MTGAVATMNTAPPPPGGGRPPSDSARGAIRVGAAILLVFFGGFGAWAVTAPLNSAVIGEAVVKVEGNRKSVQHLDGGIVVELSVREGDRVQEGDALLVLDETDHRANVEILSEQHTVLTAVEARLVAELNGLDTIVFPPELTDRRDKPSVAAAMAGQTTEFEGRRTALEGQVEVLQRRIAQLNQEIVGSQARRTSYQTQLESVVAEKRDLADLLARELIPRSRMLELERSETGLRGQVAETDAAIARAHQAIGEIDEQIAQLRKERLAEISSELRDTRSRLLDVVPRLNSARAALERTIVRAPYSGIVVDLDVFSVGGVIGRGERILDIVPDATSLVVEARIGVGDIADIRPGMAAEVHFTSYKQRTIPLIRGTVGEISADRLTDDRTGFAYYKALVAVDPVELAANPEIELYPGMPATVMITTEERTALDYLVGPLTASFDRAFRER